MLFNSLEFAVFLPLVFILYWFVFQRHLKGQNFFLLVVSYVFYGWWDWRFLSLIIFSSIIDYTIGIFLDRNDDKQSRKFLLIASLLVNLGFLGVFKYYNFFLDNFIEAFSFFGYSFSIDRLNVILPVGISFYTFQTLSYTIDVYRRKLKPTKNIIEFFAYVSFFPQLVAGPIERATNLLPQFSKKRSFNYANAVDGLRQILWGLFKKMVIADNCAVYVNDIFGNYPEQSGLTLIIGAIFFAFQIYGDFSGYSDIAIGTARLFGFSLMQNFAFPYFSRDIAEFWRRWHISLSTWFRDYLYIPLGGSKGSQLKKVRNTFAIFIVSGFWHGANWTFIFWGALNALYFLPLLLTKRNRKNLDHISKDTIFPSLKELMQMLLTFTLTLIAWIFFRSESVQEAFRYIAHIGLNTFMGLTINVSMKILVLLPFFISIEWLQRNQKHALEHINQYLPKTVRWLSYTTLIILIIAFGGDQQDFIYFQF